MIFEGLYTSDTKGKPYTGQPLFPGQRVIALDIEKVLLLQKRNHSNGRLQNSVRYQSHAQAGDVVHQSLVDFDKVVLWSTSPKILSILREFPFGEAHQRIAGATFIENNLVKDLKILTDDLSNIVALEDLDIFFTPRERVIQVRPHDNLMDKYLEARDLVMPTTL